MSSNPDQIPKSLSTNIPHSGEYVSPDALPIQEGLSAPDTAYEGFEELPPRPEERPAFDQGRAAVRDSHVAPSDPEKKNSRGIKVAIAAGAATVAAALGAWGFSVGAGGNGLIQNPNANNTPPPTPDTINSAPVTPGAIAPTPTFEAPAKSVAVTPEAIANYEELVAGAKITKGEYTTWDSIRTEFANQFTDMMNFQPSKAQLDASKDLVSEKSGLVGPEALAEQYRKAFSPLFRSGGELPNILEAKGFDTFKKWYQTRNEENPYKVTMAYNTETKLYEITDNVNLNSLPDDANGTTYNITGDIKLSNIEAGQTIDDAYFQMPGNSPITKVGTIPNQ